MRRIRERRRPLQSMRPSIPAPCVLAAASVVGVFAGEWLYGLIPPEYLYMLVVGGAILAAGVLAMLFLKRKNLVHWALAFVLIGALLGMIQLLTLDHARDEVSPGSEHYAFELSEDAKELTFGSQLIATISSGPQAGKRVMLFTNEKVELYSGDVLEADCVLSAPKEEYLAYYDQKNIAFSGSVSGFQASENSTLLSPSYQLRKQLLAVIGMGSDEQTLLRAILLGERTGLFDASFYHSIKVAGLAHLVAVSGAHLVIVTGFVTLLLKKLRVPRKLSVALQTLFLVSYVVLVGFPVSCIRAAIMSGVTLFALLAKRRSSSISALGITVMAMVAFDPSVVYQLSFQLSVAATLGIVVFMPLLNEWFQDLFPFVPQFARESISMTLAALVFSLPISAAQFSLVPLLSPLANIVATPYLSLLLMMGFAVMLVAPFVPGLLGLLSVVTSGLIAFFQAFESIPFASIPISTTMSFAFPLALGLAALSWVWWPRPSQHKRAVAACSVVLSALVIVCCLFLNAGARGDRVVMLNVGQGDSFAFISRGKTLLVDTGNEAEMLYAALARNGISKIDAVLITHPDDDHCGNLQALGGVVEVDQVFIAEGLDEIGDAGAKDFVSLVRNMVGEQKVVELNRGDTVQLGMFTLHIIAPVQVEHEGGNEDSICFNMHIDCDGDGVVDWRGFFCGDAEAEVLEELNEEHLLEPVDLYKVGHHGSLKAITPELARVLSPKVSLIGVGKNSYGHPTDDALNALESVGSEIYRSDQDGDVVCTFSPDTITVDSQNKR